MEFVTSVDGTRIAYERVGDGLPVILVPGALCDRAALRPLAEELAGEYSAVTYDRRGRGDSGDAGVDDVKREVDDIRALVEAVGGTAAVYGHSSGAALVVAALAEGLSFTKVMLHEPPYSGDDDEPDESGDRVTALLAEGRNVEAVELFLTMAGMPPEAATEMATTPGLAELAPTLRYDFEVVGYGDPDGKVPVHVLAQVNQPVLAIAGSATAPFFREAAQTIAKVAPLAEYVELPDQDHVVAPELLAPVLRRFLSQAGR